MSVTFELCEVGSLLSWIEQQGKAGEKAVSYTIKDIKSRAPGWVAAETSAVYNIKKSEITPAKTEEGKDKKAVSVYMSGETLATMAIVYTGRTLTPIHFSMTPRKPSRQRTDKISYEVIKGRRMEATGKREWSRPFLAPVKKGNKKYIVFQRKGKSRTDMYSTRTLSVPQMIGAKRVYDKIDKKIMEATEQRLQHHLDRFTAK
jgi:hypothetical protein